MCFGKSIQNPVFLYEPQSNPGPGPGPGKNLGRTRPGPGTLRNHKPGLGILKKIEPSPGPGPGYLKFMTPDTAPAPVVLSTPIGSYLEQVSQYMTGRTLTFPSNDNMSQTAFDI